MTTARIISTTRVLPIAAFLLASLASAQTTLPFAIKIQQGSTVTNATDGSSIAFQADAIGRPTDVILNITHLGTLPANAAPTATPTGSAVITAIDVSGSTDLSVTGVPDPSQVFIVNQTFSVDLRYKPSTSNRITGVIKVSYIETPVATSAVPNPKTVSGSFSLNISGVAPEFVISYAPPPGSSAIALNPNDTIQIPLVNINDTPLTSITVYNKGSGPGVVNAVAFSGAPDFTPVNFPPPATTVNPLQTLTFGLRYSPLVVEAVTGAVRIDFIDRSISYNVAASSQGPVYAYDVIADSGATAVLAGGTINLPDTPVNPTAPGTVVVRVRNIGNADGKIPNIDVSGTGFTLTQVPFVPLTLTAGSGSATFTVNFNPTQPGRQTGGLRIGTDTFVVTGNGLGGTLAYSYIAGGVTSTVLANANVIFPPIPVGGTSTLTFQITNNGTATGSVNSISVALVQPGSGTSGTGSGSGSSGTTPAATPPPPASAPPIFALAKVPQLPANIGAGETLTFTVSFAPNAVGAVAGLLRIDSVNFPISAVANNPTPLPDYRFPGATGALDPLTQAATGLTLASPYPLNLNGTLTLTFNSDVFSNDPAVQFATGGRTVNFTIPAGSTQAVFPNNQTQMRLQSGTVAGTITLTPSFVTDGGINLTPTIPPALNLTVPQTAPKLLSLQLSSKTASTITLLVTGYASGRSITEIDVQLTPVPGQNVPTTKLAINVEPSFTAWYQSTASQQFGSQFTVTLPLNVAGDIVADANVPNLNNPTDTISAVSLTLTNRQGVSASQSVTLR